jgi:hypothetical protein
LELGSFLAHAHDFCNLISFAGIILLACLEQDGSKIVEDYRATFQEEFKLEPQCSKVNEDNFCSKYIVLGDMRRLLGEMTSVMQKEKTRWEEHPQIENDMHKSLPWMQNDKVIYVWNKINEYFAKKNKPQEEAEMARLLDMFSI